MMMKWAAVMAVMGRLRNMTPLERWFFVVSSDDHITVVAVVALAQGTLCGKVRRSVGDSGCVLLLRVLLLQLLLLFKVQWWRCTLEDKRRQEAMSQNNNNDLLIRLQEMERAQLIATLCEQFNLGLLHGSGFCYLKAAGICFCLPALGGAGRQAETVDIERARQTSVKQQIIPAIIHAAEAIRHVELKTYLCTAIQNIMGIDFPERWTGFGDVILPLLRSS
ncbi:hypothetical protein GPALN_012344 [Globodera pallida]|nr:hypothetical protein GPALN_012344 [Globodera pallida]